MNNVYAKILYVRTLKVTWLKYNLYDLVIKIAQQVIGFYLMFFDSLDHCSMK